MLLGSQLWAQGSCVDITVDSIVDAECNTPSSYTGSVDISVANGSGNYTYEWQYSSNGGAVFPPQTTEDAANLPPNNYQIEVTDVGNGCTEVQAVTVGFVGLVDAEVIAAPFSTDTVHFNEWAFDTLTLNNYACDANVRPEFTISHTSQYIDNTHLDLEYYDLLGGGWTSIYAKNNAGDVVGFYGDTTGTQANQPTSSRTVRVKFNAAAPTGLYTAEFELWEVDNTGAKLQKLDSADVVQLSLVNGCPSFVADDTITDASCYGENDGGIGLTVYGGSPPYTYQWSTGQTADSIGTLVADTYWVEVQDAGVCVLIDTFVVAQPANAIPLLKYVDDITPVSAAIKFSPSTSIDFYRFKYRPLGAASWSWAGIGGPNGAATLDSVKVLNNLQSNTTYEWVMQVTSLNGCVDGWTNPEYFTTGCAELSISTNDPSCFQGSDGGMTVNVQGTGSYTYLWNNGVTTVTNTGLSAGTYSVVVTHSSGCTESDSATLIEPQPLSTSLPEHYFVCGPDTMITPGNYQTYLWGGGETTSSLYVNTNGTYTVEVVDANGCVAYDTTTVEIVDVTPVQSFFTICEGDSIVLDVNANGNYTYTWLLGGGQYLYGQMHQLVPTSNGLYQLTASGVMANCDYLISVQVFDMPELTLGHTDVSCPGGSDGTAFGAGTTGFPPYTYQWSTTETTDTISNLVAGTYTMTLTDGKNCQVTDSVTITEPSNIEVQFTTTPPSCFAASDGAISISISGGTAPYTVLWANSLGSALSLQGLTAGSYPLTVTDASGCVHLDTVVLTEPTDLLLSEDLSQHIDVDCNGQSTASLTVVASGATPAYTYSIGGATQSLPTFNNLSAGTYEVLVTDANACQDSVTVLITEPAALVLSELIHEDVSCYAGVDGSLELLATGGTAPYVFSKNGLPYQDSAIFNYLSAGTYMMFVQDSNACTESLLVTITQPTVLSYTLEEHDPSCHGEADAWATLAGSGGTAPYTISWSTTYVGDTLENLSSGNYTVWIEDANQCVDSTSFVLVDPTEFLLVEDVAYTQIVSCFGGNDGSFSVIASGGVPSYQYALDGALPQSGNSFSNLTAGTYTVVAFDANQCTDTVAVLIDQLQLVLEEDTNAHADVSCYGGLNGSVTLMSSGGTAAYQYAMDGGSYQSSSTFNSLTEGTYEFTVLDANQCPDTILVTITQPLAPLQLEEDSLLHQDVSCYGGNDGELVLSATGGTAPYSYLLTGFPLQSTANFSSLTEGTYTATVLDANLCSENMSIQILEADSFSFVPVVSSPSCYGLSDGEAQLTVTGGTGSASVLWSNGDIGSLADTLMAGSYFAYVTDSNLCQDSVEVIVSQPDSVQLQETLAAHEDVSCYGYADGVLQVSATGGTPSYTYQLNGGLPQTSAYFNGLVEGVYSLSVSDANACVDSLQINISQPTALSFQEVLASHENINCYNGSNGQIEMLASGGTPAYQYTLNGGNFQSIGLFTGLSAGTYTMDVYDANGCVTNSVVVSLSQPSLPLLLSEDTLLHQNVSCFSGDDGQIVLSASGGTTTYLYAIANQAYQATASFNNLSAGQYTFYVQDANACLDTAVFVVTEPSLLSMNTGQLNLLCNNDSSGSVMVNAYGGTAPYEYLWNTGDTIDTLSHLSAGTYIITLVDSNTCQLIDTIMLTEPALLAQTLSTNGVSCYGLSNGYINVSAQGGTPNYQYSLEGGPWQSLAQFTGLAEGVYQLATQDANGCLDSSSISVVQPDSLELLLTDSMFMLTCYGDNDGMAEYTALGGTANFFYLLNGLPQPSANFSSLTAGVYEVEVYDANNCSDSSSFEVIQADSIQLSAAVNDASCYGIYDGEVLLSTIGGYQPYQYEFDTIAFQSDSLFDGLMIGMYTFAVKDSIGCVVLDSALVSQPDSLALSIIAEEPSCFEECDGSLTAQIATPGTYTYMWSTNSFADAIDSVCAGYYTLTVIDSMGCSTFAAYNLGQPLPVYPVISQFGASLQVSGSYDSYQWYHGDSLVVGADSSTFFPEEEGEYTVVVVDAKGCEGVSADFYFVDVHVASYGNTMRLYPNPVHDVFHVDLSTSAAVFWKLMDVQGKVLASNKEQGSFSLSVGDYLPGVYFVQLTIDGAAHTYKLIKH